MHILKHAKWNDGDNWWLAFFQLMLFSQREWFTVVGHGSSAKNTSPTWSPMSRLGVSNVIQRCKAANGNQAPSNCDVGEANLCGMMGIMGLERGKMYSTLGYFRCLICFDVWFCACWIQRSYEERIFAWITKLSWYESHWTVDNGTVHMQKQQRRIHVPPCGCPVVKSTPFATSNMLELSVWRLGMDAGVKRWDVPGLEVVAGRITVKSYGSKTSA